MTDTKDTMENDLNESIKLAESIEEPQEDFTSYSKEELVKYLENIQYKDNISKVTHNITLVKAAFDQFFEHEKEEALQRFIQEGGEEKDFEYKKDTLTLKFDKLYTRIKAEVSEYYSNLEKAKTKNLEIKNELLERLRKLISSEESSLSLDEFKHIQEEWKKTGQVPQAQSQELWNNYKALVDIFYNNRSIFFELKELDRKKNLDTKKEICEKVEKLLSLDSITQALRELKNLHEEFRLIGPVPKDEQESLWNRMKEASDKIYEKRKDYIQNQKSIQEQNLILKQSIIEKAEAFVSFTSSRIDDWKAKTAELQKVQEEWRSIGAMPQDKVKEYSHKFWEVCKAYYKNKNNFFKELDHKREENLQKKIALCEKVESMKDNADFDATAREIKEIQKQWEKIGQVPFKQKDKIFARFKEACDYFFAKKREQLAEVEKEFVQNLESKKTLLSEIESYISSAEAKTIDKLKEFQSAWNAIGFVPRDAKKEITDKYNQVLSKFIDASQEIGQEAKNNIRLSLEVLSLKASQDGLAQLKKKEQGLQKRASGIKSEIERYKTNIEFFGKSKGAEQMRAEIQQNIDLLEKELKAVNEELKIVKG